MATARKNDFEVNPGTPTSSNSTSPPPVTPPSSSSSIGSPLMSSPTLFSPAARSLSISARLNTWESVNTQIEQQLKLIVKKQPVDAVSQRKIIETYAQERKLDVIQTKGVPIKIAPPIPPQQKPPGQAGYSRYEIYHGKQGGYQKALFLLKDKQEQLYVANLTCQNTVNNPDFAQQFPLGEHQPANNTFCFVIVGIPRNTESGIVIDYDLLLQEGINNVNMHQVIGACAPTIVAAGELKFANGKLIESNARSGSFRISNENVIEALCIVLGPELTNATFNAKASLSPEANIPRSAASAQAASAASTPAPVQVPVLAQEAQQKNLHALQM